MKQTSADERRDPPVALSSLIRFAVVGRLMSSEACPAPSESDILSRHLIHVFNSYEPHAAVNPARVGQAGLDSLRNTQRRTTKARQLSPVENERRHLAQCPFLRCPPERRSVSVVRAGSLFSRLESGG